ncbi:MAG: endonuclease V, partial [Archaeoglobaceae archaeon]|nr:endonuclease V [Archaeoglobaceae archaeon]
DVYKRQDIRIIRDGEKIIGYTLRVSKKYKEIYISPGSFISPKTALEVVKICMHGELPLPIKVAHEFGQELKATML